MKYTCFVISPIGDEGTELHEEYQDLFDLIIVPALEVFDMEVKRGDHFVTDDKIDASVIKNIQDADICICDISIPNPNVYYELGRRDETGKPILLLKKKGTAQSPVDIATRRYFEYEWDGRHAIREAQEHIRDFVRPLIEQGFVSRGNSATLGDIAESISRLERKIDRIGTKSGYAGSAAPVPSSTDQTDPRDKFKYALMQKNIPMAEEAMGQLQYRMEKLNFYDQVVEQVAALGSNIAGEMMIAEAGEFFDSDMTFKQKIEYLACLVTYANQTDKEEQIFDIAESAFHILEKQTDGEDPKIVIQLYNQQNRLYFGLFANTRNPDWMTRAVAALKKAIAISPSDFLYYNLSTCYYSYANSTQDSDAMLDAKEAIEKCLSLDGDEVDKDHLSLACKIYANLGDPKYDDMLDQLQQIDPIGAMVLANSLKE